MKFKILDRVWCIHQDKVKHLYVSTITIRFGSIHYYLAKDRQDVEEMEEIGWQFEENKLFYSKQDLLDSL